MSKSRLLLIIVCLFLVHSQAVATSSLGTLPLTPPVKVSPIETDQDTIFLRRFNILAFALAMYYLDADERLSKDELKERLADNLDWWREKFKIVFDLDKTKKHGFMRDYPFTVKNKSFIIRLFDIRDEHYLKRRLSDENEILCEGKFKEGIGFQILPGINEILKSKKPKKALFQNPALCSTRP